MGDSCAGGGWYGGYKTYWSPGGGGSGHINENKVSNGSMQNGYTKEESKNGNGYAQITLVSIDDTTPPTCTITPQVGNPTNASTIQYNINFSEEVYNFERTDISVQNGTITNFWGSGANYAITVTNGGSCTQTITVGANVCNDFAGNGNIGASASRLIDRTLPTIAVNPTSGGYVKTRNVTITVGETGGSGLSNSNSYQYYLSKSNTTLTEGTWTNYTSGTAFTIGAGKTGKYYLFVKKIGDNAGNINTTAGIAEKTIEGIPCQVYGEYYFDNTPPIITKAELINNVVKIEANDVNEENSGLSKYRYITSTIRLVNPNINVQNSTEKPATGQIAIPNINEIRYIYVLVEDMVGNTSRIVEIEVPQITLEGEVNLEAEERKGGVDLRWQIGGKGDKTYKIYQKDVTGSQWREINITNELVMTTNTSKDIAAPNSPTIKVNEIDENDEINISYTTTDNGSTYKFYAKACDRVNNNIILSTSGEITKEIKTGVKGYYYIIDERLDNEFNIENAIYTEEEHLKLDLKYNGKYIRMKAVDMAGNLSEESNSIIYKISSLKENLDGGTLNGKTGTVTVTELAGKRIDIGEAEKEGHTFDAWEVKKGLEVGKNGSLLGTKFTFGRESGEVTARYEINNYGYKIEYYYAGIKDESKTKIGVAEYSSIIEEYEEQLKDGYILGRTENYPLTIRAEDNKIEGETITEEEANKIKNNIIKIYYEKRTDLEYTINYLEEGTNKIIYPPKEAKGQIFEDIILANDEIINIPGYYYKSSDRDNITIAVNKEQNVINLYYTKRNDLTYTVRYLEKGTEKEIYPQRIVENQTFESQVSTTKEIIVIDGYNYDSIENDPITITANEEENIVKVYYTKRNDLIYAIRYLEKGSKRELNPQKVVENQTFEDIVIAKDEIIAITGYNYDSSNKEILTITTNEKENIMELYYTKRNDLKYTVNYLEEETHEQLHEPRVIENQEFEDTIIAKEQAIEIEGYEYSGSDKEKIIIGINEEENVIDIYYIKRSDLTYTVNYIDKETGEEIHESKKELNQVYGGKVIASNEIIEIEGYNYSNSDKDEITIGVDENVINMYYTIRKDIKYKIEYYYDGIKDEEKTEEGEATYKETIEEYEEKMPEGYTLIQVTGIPLIIGTKEDINVIKVYYGTKAQITIKYIDKNTEEILEEIIEEGYVGKEYETEAKDFENYVLVEEPEEKTIIMTKEEIIIEYKYAYISSGVIEKHIDVDTGAILYNEVHEGYDGKEYKTEAKEFERYHLVEEKYPQNSEGIMEKEAITVTYYYKKEEKIKITINYLDKETKDKIEKEQIIENYKGEKYKTEKKEIQGYEFIEVVGQTEGIISEEQEIIYYYQKIKVPDKNEEEMSDSTTTNGRIPNAGMVKQVVTGTAFIAMIITIATLLVFAIKGTIIYRKYRR
ncbi:MAG: hypothetical protein HFJ47_00255 [Clostridia bacterium]|nr:hypothetical protein [Clostridia bacterium]